VRRSLTLSLSLPLSLSLAGSPSLSLTHTRWLSRSLSLSFSLAFSLCPQQRAREPLGSAGKKKCVYHGSKVSGRGTARAEDAEGTPTRGHMSPSILVYKHYHGLKATWPPSILISQKCSPSRFAKVDSSAHSSTCYLCW
jgi:hypothetical protein